MSGNNQGADTLSSISQGGRGKAPPSGTGRGQNRTPQPNVGRGSVIPPQLTHQYQHQQTPQYQHQQMLPQGSYTTTSTTPTYVPQQSHDYTLDTFLAQQIPHQQPRQPQQPVSSLFSSLSSSPQQSKSTDNNKKIISLLINIVNTIEKHNDTLKKIDDRTKNIDDNIRDINNNLVSKEYISEVLSSLSRLPAQDTKSDDDDDDKDTQQALDDAINRITNMSTDSNIVHSDNNQDNQ